MKIKGRFLLMLFTGLLLGLRLTAFAEEDIPVPDVPQTKTIITGYENLPEFSTVRILQNNYDNLDDLRIACYNCRTVTATVTLPDGTPGTCSLDVYWPILNMQEVQTDPSTLGSYTETGTIQLPDDTYEFADGVAQTLSIPVEIYAPDEPFIIADIETFNQEYLAVETGTNLDTLLYSMPYHTWSCYEENGTHHEAEIQWDTSALDLSAAGLYTVTGTPILPLHCILADGLALPTVPITVSVQDPGCPELNCMFPYNTFLQFLWVTPPGELDSCTVWLRENEGEWTQLTTTQYLLAGHNLKLKNRILNLGSIYQLQVDYEGGQTGIVTFVYDSDPSILNYKQGDRDGGDTDGNAPSGGQIGSGNPGSGSGAGDSGNSGESESGTGDSGNSGESGSGDSGSGSGGSDSGNSGSGTSGSGAGGSSASSGSTTGSTAGTSSPDTSASGSTSTPAGSADTAADNAAANSDSVSTTDTSSATSETTSSAAGTDTTAAAGASADTGSADSDSVENTDKTETDTAQESSINDDPNTVSGKTILQMLSSTGSARFSSEGITVLFQAASMKELNIQDEDVFLIEIIPETGNAFTIRVTRNGETLTDFPKMQIMVPYESQNGSVEPEPGLYDQQDQLTAKGTWNSAQNLAVFELDHTGTYRILDTGSTSAPAAETAPETEIIPDETPLTDDNGETFSLPILLLAPLIALIIIAVIFICRKRRS